MNGQNLDSKFEEVIVCESRERELLLSRAPPIKIFDEKWLQLFINESSLFVTKIPAKMFLIEEC